MCCVAEYLLYNRLNIQNILSCKSDDVGERRHWHQINLIMFNCASCEKSFTKKWSMQRHTLQKHIVNARGDGGGEDKVCKELNTTSSNLFTDPKINITEDMIKTANKIQAKYNRLKANKMLHQSQLKDTFKTISGPLNRLVKLTTNTPKPQQNVYAKRIKIEKIEGKHENTDDSDSEVSDDTVINDDGDDIETFYTDNEEEEEEELNSHNIDYTSWNDPNELVDRLRLLTASKHAGNTSHNNEIVSILEELREAGIIKYLYTLSSFYK